MISRSFAGLRPSVVPADFEQIGRDHVIGRNEGLRFGQGGLGRGVVGKDFRFRQLVHPAVVFPIKHFAGPKPVGGEDFQGGCGHGR